MTNVIPEYVLADSVVFHDDVVILKDRAFPPLVLELFFHRALAIAPMTLRFALLTDAHCFWPRVLAAPPAPFGLLIGLPAPSAPRRVALGEAPF